MQSYLQITNIHTNKCFKTHINIINEQKRHSNQDNVIHTITEEYIFNINKHSRNILLTT